MSHATADLGTDATWRENRPGARRFPADLAEMWAYRDLAWLLALRDVRLRYKQTAFGVAWAVLQPVSAAAVFTAIFGHWARVPSEGVTYLVFALSGLCVWTGFASTVSASAAALVEQRSLVTKVYFPRMLAPLAAMLSGLLDFALSLAVLALVAALSRVTPGPALLCLPLWLLMLLAASVGTGLWLSALNALYRDVRYALGFVLQVWFFVSPVVFPSSLVEGAWRYAYALNPMAGVIDGFRWSTVNGRPPGPEIAVSLTAAVVVLASGVAYFRAVERRLADRI